MTKYEYKMLALPMQWGIVKQILPDVSAALNNEAREGWRLSQLLSPIGSMGTSESVVAILERPVS